MMVRSPLNNLEDNYKDLHEKIMLKVEKTINYGLSTYNRAIKSGAAQYPRLFTFLFHLPCLKLLKKFITEMVKLKYYSPAPPPGRTLYPPPEPEGLEVIFMKLMEQTSDDECNFNKQGVSLLKQIVFPLNIFCFRLEVII